MCPTNRVGISPPRPITSILLDYLSPLKPLTRQRHPKVDVERLRGIG